MSEGKQIVLVAARSLRHFLNEIPNRFSDLDRITAYSSGRVETEAASYRFIRNAASLRGFHGIKFEVWGPFVELVEEAIPLIRAAEQE